MKRNNDSSYFIVFETVTFVNGYFKSLICDIVRKRSIIIPNSLYDFCRRNNKKLIRKIKAYYQANDVVNEYIDFLVEKEFAFIGTHHDVSHFVSMNLEWDNPSYITNAIIENSTINFNNIKSIANQMNKLQVEAIEFNSFISQICIDDLEKLLNAFQTIDSLRFLKLNIKYDEAVTSIEKMSELIKRHPIIQTLIIFSSPFSFHEENNDCLFFIRQTLDIQSCGVVSKEYFALILPLFSESQAHNTCLNRKLCIDAEGNIKNCPAMKQSYGNIKDTILMEAIEKPGFKNLWFIHKNLIDVCKDCEFRHICIDCRCFIKDSKNIYSHPTKCTYNPYICKWQAEKGYLPIEECGTYSKTEGFLPNHEKIKILNQQLWGDDE
jgi:SPASM domain peptide maturase of grasp-with-spasm system